MVLKSLVEYHFHKEEATMAGLADLLAIRELQEQADPFRSAFSSLAESVAA